MLNEVILLTTDWEPDYWNKPKTAIYPGKVKYTDIPNWSNLASSCPLAGLGIYYAGRKHDYSGLRFVYITITRMSYDVGTGNPRFNFEVVRPSKTSSDKLRSKLPPKYLRLISTIPIEDLLNVLSDLGEEEPEEWLKLAVVGVSQKRSPAWREFIGDYFLALERSGLGDNEFEDRIASLLKAIGFRVTQKGHKMEGAYADGIAIHADVGLVYDCKNSETFAPTEDNLRALKQYVGDETTLNRGKNLYGAFVSRGFQAEPYQNIFYLRVESLLYLLAVKLTKGIEFDLNPFALLLQKGKELDFQRIDEYWRP